jgi:transposase
MGVFRACASKWVNRWRPHGDAGLQDRPSSPHRSPNATPACVIEQIESWRREHKWSAQRITDELVGIGFVIDRRTVSRHLTRLGLGKTPLHRPRRREQPEAGDDHRPLARTHGAPRCEEGRPDP